MAGPEKGYGETSNYDDFVLTVSDGVESECPDRDPQGYCFNDYHNHSCRVEKGLVFLPHSCEEWIIGDTDSLRLLIADAHKILAEKEKRKA